MKIALILKTNCNDFVGSMGVSDERTHIETR